MLCHFFTVTQFKMENEKKMFAFARRKTKRERPIGRCEENDREDETFPQSAAFRFGQ